MSDHDDMPDLDAIDTGAITVSGSEITLAGDVDYVLVHAWRKVHPDDADVTSIDAEQVTFLGSAGVALIIRLVKRAAPERVSLRHPSRVALRPLEAMGVVQQLDVMS